MPYVSDLLTAAAASVTGTPTPTRSWQWLRGSTLISGATSSTYTVADADIGSAISVRQIESNIAGVATATSAATAAVQAFEPIALFQSGEEGAWYDPSDLSTLYQDSAGTTPVTAAGQPVGLMLDKSKGLVLGSELVDAQTASTWVAQGGNSVSDDGSEVKIEYVDNPNGAKLPFTDAAALSANLVVGKTYKVSFNARVNAGASVGVFIWTGASNGGTLTVSSTSTTTYTGYFVAQSTTLASLSVSSFGSGEIVWVSNVTLKELPGNHATQSTSTARPTLQTSGGLYYLEFVADDLMQTAAFASPLAQPNFISLAGLLPDSTSVSALYFDGLTAGSRHFAYANKNSTTFIVGTDGGTYSGTEPDGTSTNVWSFNFDGAGSYLRQDGTQVATGNTGATTFGGLTLMGNINSAASPHTTNMHGFVLVNRALTAAEIASLESYLADKSGVTLP